MTRITRRGFVKGAIAGAALPILPRFSTPALALGPLAVFVGVMSLAKTVVDATATRFEARQDPNARNADPHLQALLKNREVLRAAHQRLDAVDAALSAIMIQNQILPEVIDQVVADRIRSMVPDIVRSELGKFATERNAADLASVVTTFIEDVELRLPADRLNTRLDRIREFRNRVLGGPNFSILTLCASMDVELAGMKILGYSRSQAETVAAIYSREFNAVRDETRSGALFNTFQRLAGEEQTLRTSVSREIADRRHYQANQTLWCDIPMTPETRETPLVTSNGQSFPIVYLDWPYVDFRASHVLNHYCAPRAANQAPCDPGRQVDFWAPHGGCASTPDQANEIMSGLQSLLTEWNDKANTISGLRASMLEILITVTRTQSRLDEELRSWDT